MDNETKRNIMTEYENLRSQAKRERDARVAEAYRHVPELKEIVNKINSLGQDTMSALLKNPMDTSPRDEMKKKFRILTQRREELLRANHIPLDFDKIQPKCSFCNDTGYIEGKGKCSCYRQRIIDILYKQSNMSEILKKQNFGTFSTQYYSKSSVRGLDKTPYENILNIRKICEDFIANFDSEAKNLVFYGDTGLGKTFMSSCIAKELLDQGKTVLYLRATKLFRLFDDDKFGRLKEGIDDIYSCDLLIIDDLGTEAASKNNASYLLDLINDRIDREKKIIINTNLNYTGLENTYSKRFSSRLLDSFVLVYFYGKDIRQQKLFSK